jgi:hypothetical protein
MVTFSANFFRWSSALCIPMNIPGFP